MFGNDEAMPRADYLTLNAAGLDMPSVDHLSNRSAVNVLLDRAFSHVPAGIPPDRTLVGLFQNFVRLTDKALREYDAARVELTRYFTLTNTSLRSPVYIRGVDHLENCIGATHRAVLNARALQQNKIGRSGPKPTMQQELRLRNVRHAIEHSDEKILGIPYRHSPPFTATEPYSLRLANKHMVIGSSVLSYKQLVSVMAKLYRTIEVIRGVATGTPGPAWPNARLRTEFPGGAQTQGGSIRVSDYLQELSRLTVTH
jgi:hypothetical protein